MRFLVRLLFIRVHWASIDRGESERFDSQRLDVIAAIAEKDAAAALAAAAPAAAAPILENARPVAAQSSRKANPKAPLRPDLKEPIKPANGGSVTEFRCKQCNVPVYFKNWGRHCHQFHKADESAQEANDDDGDKCDDDADQTDDVQPEISDARSNPAPAGNDAAIRQRAAEPRKSYGPKKSEPRAVATKRGQEDSAGDDGTQIAKRSRGKVASKKISASVESVS